MKAVDNLIFAIIRQENLILKKAWTQIAELAENSLAYSGMSSQEAARLWSRMDEALKRGVEKAETLSQIEDALRELSGTRERDPRQTYARLIRRAERCYRNIEEYLSGRTLLDFGAGSGLLANLIHQRKRMQVSLVDVVNYSMVSHPYYSYEQMDKLVFENRGFDCTLAYLVLHHTDDPFQSLKEVARVTKRRLIIVEGEVEEPEKYFVNCFLDWIHNRVLSGINIHVPLNFQTVANWHEWFAKLNLRPRKTQMLGVDDLSAPQFHVLFVLDKNDQ